MSETLEEAALKAHKEILRRRSEAGAAHKQKRIEQQKRYRKAANATFEDLDVMDEKTIMPAYQKTNDGSLIFVGKVHNEVYKIILNDKNSRFYIARRHRFFPMAPEFVAPIFMQLNEKLNQNGEFDEVLSYFTSRYEDFRFFLQKRQKKGFSIKISSGHVVAAHRKQICRLLAPQIFESHLREV